MGLLSLGTPLPWADSRQYNDHVRRNGLQQLQRCFDSAAARTNDPYLWGDEVEYSLVKFDTENKRATLSIDKDYILEDLNDNGSLAGLARKNDLNFHPEYGRFMIEATPAEPYDGESLDQYLYVEKNMNDRRTVADIALGDRSIRPVTITAFPLMGVGHFTTPPANANGKASRSLFLPDDIINRHVRFPTLTANIRRRRGEKVAINIPLYKDKYTPDTDGTPIRDLFPEDEESQIGAAKPGHIYMDSMGFGMGNSCLQVTVQAPNIAKARYLYDSWVNLAPVFLSLSAAAPVFKGWLSDQDVRWNIISGAVDDRTPFERGVAPLRKGNGYGGIAEDKRQDVQRVSKSRYDSVDSYLGDVKDNSSASTSYGFFKPELNDIDPPVNENVLNELRSNPHFDEPLARHFAHLYIRDPIVIFNERVNQDNDIETDHFENIQSTNWQTLRFKPPTQAATPDNKSVPGWRVEFRSMEIQITDFENAAFSVFITLLGSALLANADKWNFYIPISQVEENMTTAHVRDSTLTSKFHFVKDYTSRDFASVQLSVDEIINGTSTGFLGLIQLVKAHIQERFSLELSPRGPYARLYWYIKLIELRASGAIPTMASYIRSFVTTHHGYHQDSHISELVNFDLLEQLQKITDGDENALLDFFGEEIGAYLFREAIVSQGLENGVTKENGVTH